LLEIRLVLRRRAIRLTNGKVIEDGLSGGRGSSRAVFGAPVAAARREARPPDGPLGFCQIKASNPTWSRSVAPAWSLTVLLACASLAALPSCRQVVDRIPFTDEEISRIQQHSPLPPPPPDPTNAVAGDPTAAHLGQYLFFDRRLSSTGSVSCASCHDPELGWGNGKRVGEAIGLTTRNVPTLWNTAYNRWFFWDGRADSQWAQALQPLEDPAEHGGSRLQYVQLICRDRNLREAYETVFGALPELSRLDRLPSVGGPVGTDLNSERDAWESLSESDRQLVDRIFSNLGKAIAAYARKIVSHDAPFDRFAQGLRDGDPAKLAALSLSAQRGLKLFIGLGNCRLCHVGPNFTDGEFHSLGLAPRDGAPRDPGRHAGVHRLLADPFNTLGPYSDAPGYSGRDHLRFLAPNEATRGQFKTPTLRSVAETGPYMHDGRFERLEEVIQFYSTREGAEAPHHGAESVLQPLHLSDSGRDDLVAFLRSLTGAPLEQALKRQPETPLLKLESQATARP
jgi:cytochrome c peroxidase